MLSSMTPLTKAVGVPETPFDMAYFHMARVFELVLNLSPS